MSFGRNDKGRRHEGVVEVRRGFEKLNVWKEAIELSVQIYECSKVGGLARDLDLRNQMRRSAVSVPSNIAEGDERETDKESIRFFYIAKGSLAELRTQLLIAHRIKALDPQTYLMLDRESQGIANMLGALIKARRNY